MVPASLILHTTGESTLAVIPFLLSRSPVYGIPMTEWDSLMVHGIPNSGFLSWEYSGSVNGPERILSTSHASHIACSNQLQMAVFKCGLLYSIC